jgi:hypothetical protein
MALYRGYARLRETCNYSKRLKEINMGGKYSITARNINDNSWEICDYSLNLFQFIFKGIYCLIKYDVVNLGKHGK